MRFAVHVQPGAKLPKVGGSKGGSLSVKVADRAVDGAANAAVLDAVAASFGLPKRSVRIVHGRTSRRKLLDVTIDEEEGQRILRDLLDRT